MDDGKNSKLIHKVSEEQTFELNYSDVGNGLDNGEFKIKLNTYAENV